MIDKNHYLNEWRKQKELKSEQTLRRLIEENRLLRSELNKSLQSLCTPIYGFPKEKYIEERFKQWLNEEIHIKEDEFDKDLKGAIDKELASERIQGHGWGPNYTTSVKKSWAASEYLIEHTCQPLDFDAFHKEFQINMDKGGQIFPQDTLNWHTYIQLKRKGYTYKLFSIETNIGEYPKGIRYILVDKEDKIIWGNKSEKEHRSFNNEFHYYRGAYYNSNFELIKEKTNESQ